MRIFLLLIFIFSFSFGQNKEIDSLRNVLKQRPQDFYLQTTLITKLSEHSFFPELNKELEQAKVRFKNNKDYYTYFKVSEAYLLLKEQKNSQANEKLIYFSKTINFTNLPTAHLYFNYLKGLAEKRLGNSKASENYYTKCFQIIKENKLDKGKFAYIYNTYSSSLINMGEYEKALTVLFDVLKMKDFDDLGSVYSKIGICYFSLKQYKKAEKFYLLSIVNSDQETIANSTANLAILYLESNDYQKAENTISKLDFRKLTSSDSAAVFNVLGEVEKQKGNYKKAIENFKIVENIDLKNGNNSYLMNDYLAIGNLYLEIKDYNQAEHYLKKSYQLSIEYDDENAKMEVLKTLLELEFSQNNNAVAEKYFQEFVDVSDSINSGAVHENTNALHLKYETELKESKIKLQQAEIQKAKINKNIAITGITFLVLLFGSSFWFFKNKQKNTQLQTQNTLLSLQQNLNSMELQNLNKQLDPHEIKNLLASISPEIQEKAPDSYRKMLKLLNVTKASLGNNSLTESVENQVQQIDDFLSLNKNSLSEPLEYEIENKIENQEVQLPRLILKNLVENSIKHGIKGKKSGGKISVSIEEKNNFILVKVDDTGKGRLNAISTDSGIGTTTYQKLFTTLNQKNEEKASFEIIDKEQGTLVEVKIPIDYKYL